MEQNSIQAQEETTVAEITEEALVAALKEALKTDDNLRPRGALTTRELQEILGWSGDRVRRELKKLKVQGKLEVIDVPVITLDNRVQRVTGYRLENITDGHKPAQVHTGDNRPLAG